MDIESRLARLEERVDGILTSTSVAKTEVDRRLDEMNELRRQIEKERGRYLEVDRYDERHEDIQNLVNSLDRRLSTIEGGSQIKATTIGWGIAAMGVALTVIVVVVNVLTGNI